MPTEQGQLGKSNSGMRCLSTDQFTSLFISQESHMSMLTPKGWRSCIPLFLFIIKTANIISCIQTVKRGVGELTQGLRILPALSEDSKLVPSSHDEQLTHCCLQLRLQGIWCPPPAPQLCTHMADIHKSTHTEIKITNININKNIASLLSLYIIINKNS